MKLSIVLSLISLISAETSVTIFSNKAINEVSERFISHEIDFYDLIQYRGNLALVTPSYLKLKNFLEYIKKFDQHDFNKSGVSNIFRSLYRNKITPIIVIDYNISNFEPITLLEDLKRAKDLNVKECIWQLGKNLMESNYGETKKYTEDLKTLQILCESVRKDNKFSWKVASASSQLDDKIVLDIEGYDYGRYTTDEILTKSTLMTNVKHNTWITIANNSKEIAHGKSPKSCDENCLVYGLNYAQVLGEAAKKGADVVFVESQDISTLNSNNFKQAIDKLHNALIGTRVFKVRSSMSSYDKKQSSVYAYCSKKMNGGVTLMGINYSNARDKINSKLSTTIYESNSIVLQYVLSIADGQVMMNNERYNGTIAPVYKFKKTPKFTLDFTIPPFSIAFWVLKTAKEKECINNMKSLDANKVRKQGTSVASSSDDLLKILAANALRKENQRIKRQISNVSPLLPKIDFNIASLVPSNINQRSIKDVFFNKNTEVYKVAPIEANPLQSSENPALPNGDVYLLIDDGSINDYVDAEIQYPTVNANHVRQKQLQQYQQQQLQQPKSNKKIPKEKVEMPNEYLSSYDYIESTYKASKKSQKPKKSSQQDKIVGELFEIDNIPKNHHYDQMKSSSNSNNVEIKTVMRELEPTYRQSKKAIIAAKRKWNQNQLMELLKDATLQEVDKSQIHDANEFQIIDLSNNEDNPFDYEEYEDKDEDGFFSSDTPKYRSRRSVDYRKNEISRSDNFHLFNDSDENNISESIEDVHLYLHPRNQDNQKFQQLSAPTSTTENSIKIDENSPLGVKLIDVFTKSLDDIIFTVHKNLLSWWYVFEPPSYE